MCFSSVINNKCHVLFIALNEVYGPTLCCLYSRILHQSGIGMYIHDCTLHILLQDNICPNCAAIHEQW